MVTNYHYVFIQSGGGSRPFETTATGNFSPVLIPSLLITREDGDGQKIRINFVSTALSITGRAFLFLIGYWCG